MKLSIALIVAAFAIVPSVAFAEGITVQQRPEQTPADRVTCINALRAFRLTGHDSPKLGASIVYLAMRNAQDDPKGETVTDRYLEILSELQDQPLPTATEAEAMIKRCYTADSLASGDQVRAFPANAFKRDLVCRAALFLVIQSSRRLGDTPERKRLTEVETRFAAKTTPQRYYENGLRTEAAMKALVLEIAISSLSIGTSYAIADACSTLA
ncbi:hypothetical protein [Sphingomonas sp. LM7]|uniref:hypothetical protein n=1 Tax=Sphingomonas sp. LM7 TaxID=1938607 RepID=UPI0009838CDA|nr:hypothetical protein [Sphingomonas sp. LM7]AQR73056.1 hypothetical protein BXU08_04650 [Sphingomonas sp. LM7]